jgi:hypothetical protein
MRFPGLLRNLLGLISVVSVSPAVVSYRDAMKKHKPEKRFDAWRELS